MWGIYYLAATDADRLELIVEIAATDIAQHDTERAPSPMDDSDLIAIAECIEAM